MKRVGRRFRFLRALGLAKAATEPVRELTASAILARLAEREGYFVDKLAAMRPPSMPIGLLCEHLEHAAAGDAAATCRFDLIAPERVESDAEVEAAVLARMRSTIAERLEERESRQHRVTQRPRFQRYGDWRAI